MTLHPHHGKGELIPLVEHISATIEAVAHADPGSRGGTGGMLTKIRAARKATFNGVDMVIASGKKAGVLTRLSRGEPVGTFFIHQR